MKICDVCYTLGGVQIAMFKKETKPNRVAFVKLNVQKKYVLEISYIF